MAILPMSLSVPATPHSLSSKEFLSGGPIWSQSLSLTKKFSHLSLKTTPIRMGGGPRTYPGGVSKWQWKRMQSKKAKQLLKARLARERQIYEMRKRAELKAAVSELERPWEAVEKPPNLFSVSADEQLKVLADRFQKPGGLDLWTDNDGPELFRPDNGLPSSRFFPKGVVHSIKPYGKTKKLDTADEEFEGSGLGEYSGSGRCRENDGEMGLEGKGSLGNSRNGRGGMNERGRVGGVETRSKDGLVKVGENRNLNGDFRKKETRRVHMSDSEGMGSRNAGLYDMNDRSMRGMETRSKNGLVKEGENRNLNGDFRKKETRRVHMSDSEGMGSRNAGLYDMNDRSMRGIETRSRNGLVKEGENRNLNGKYRKETRRVHMSDSEGMSSRNAGLYDMNDRSMRGIETRSRNGLVKEGENRNLNGKYRKETRRVMSDSEETSSGNSRFYDMNDRRSRGQVGSSREFRRESRSKDGLVKEGENRNLYGDFRKKETRRVHMSDSEGMSSGNARFYDMNDRRSRGPGGSSREFRSNSEKKSRQNVDSDVFDMNLQNDGSYGFEL